MLEYLINDNIVAKEDRIAVGVSGGADSMVLLWALLDKQKQVGFYFEVINVNHHIRGAESDRDSLFVEDFCKKRKIPYKIVDVDVLKLKKDEKKTLEESARTARFEVFEKIMKQDKLNKLFLAHHKNDQAETILMHIFRGSGVSGASGIKDTKTTFRPLLNLSKTEILKLTKEHGIDYVEDSTNDDSTYTRNFIRNRIIPQIEEVYPGLVDNICAFGKKCENLQAFIVSQVNENLILENKDEVVLNQQIFELDKILVREYIKKAFEKLGVYSDIETKHFSLVYELAFLEVNKEISLPHGIVARKIYSGVKLLKNKQAQTMGKEYEFVKNGIVNFGDDFIINTQVVKSDEVVYGEGSLFIDATKVSNNAVWRTRRNGDRFAKFGTGSKKLNDYLTNKKIDAQNRDNIPLLASGESVLVVLGDDISENVKIDSTTDEIVKITFDKR